MQHPLIRLQFGCAGVDWQQLLMLFRLSELAGREGDKLRRAFVASTEACFAFDGEQLIGAARALSDHEYHAFVYDVVVHPQWQRRGVGSRLMRALLERLPVWRILLVADGDARRFCQRLGFADCGDVMARVDRTRLQDEMPPA